MPSQFFGLNIGASALSAFQASVNTTVNNISNVQTKGYTRQTTTLESSTPIRVNAKYGSVGTGVSATAITQERNLYYDTKYWQNSSSKGYFEQKKYYLEQVETLLEDDGVQEGFTTIFAKMFNGLDTLKTKGEEESVRNQFIHQAQSLCTYFNSLSKSLSQMQEDCNEEIKSSVNTINGISQKIATLNKEINMIEVRGGHANELRDQRANLVDQLSEMVNTETQEYEVHNSYGQDLGGTNYRVIINGQVLVDGNDYRTLDCKTQDYRNNQSDAEGMYEICWSDNGMDFAATSGSASGSLKALFSVRDGNNAESMTGVVQSADTKNITMKWPSVTDVNKLALPEKGLITINSKKYKYDGWDAQVGEDGITSIQFHLTQDIDAEEAGALADSQMVCGDNVDALGIPYYQSQINEFVRSFVQAFNDIEKTGVDLKKNPMGAFFVGNTAMGTSFGGDDWDAKVAAAKKEKENGGTYGFTISSKEDSYYNITADNVAVNSKSLQDPSYFSTATEMNNGEAKYDIAEKLLTLQKDVKMFRGDSAESFLETLLSDITVDVDKTNTNYKNYFNLQTAVNNQRTSVSGVDEDEEALNLIKFQNAYNLASKVISVMAEMYDKLINETGV
jgi:flagellar hook-associated protein 1 FlgK